MSGSLQRKSSISIRMLCTLTVTNMTNRLLSQDSILAIKRKTGQSADDVDRPPYLFLMSICEILCPLCHHKKRQMYGVVLWMNPRVCVRANLLSFISPAFFKIGYNWIFGQLLASFRSRHKTPDGTMRA